MTSNFSAYGAVDLGALAQRATSARTGPAAASPGGTSGADGHVVDVTEATFEAEVLQRSATVPVVIDFWAEWCGPCKQLSPVLERLATEYAGRFVLAKIDVDANQQLAAAAGVQSIPLVLGVVQAQAVPLFAGAYPEAQVRQYLDELLRVAAANGVAGEATVEQPAAGEESIAAAEAPGDPRYDEAYDAIDRGDLDAAAAAYRRLIADSPADDDARAGLAQVELMQRVQGGDPAAVRAAAAQRPDDVDAQGAAADLDLLDGRVDEAFTRLVETVRRTAGEDRDRARARLLELFQVVGSSDPRVVQARAALASALF